MNYRFFIVIVSITSILAVKINAKEFCHDPNQFEGACKHIKDCPNILNEFLAKNNDSSYRQYIQQSNAICENIKPFICCPFDGRKYQLTESSFQGRLLTPSEGCGLSNQNQKLRFGGKVKSKLGAFPWSALLGYTNNKEEISWECGGSLITTRHVLTSARCVTSNLFMVRLGEYDFSSAHREGVRNIGVIRSERHPSYNELDGTNDIAILYLERDVDISPRIRPICLPISDPIRNRSFVDYNPYVAGWELSQNKDGSSFNFPSEQQYPVLENEACKERYRQKGELMSESQFDERVFCVGYFRGDLQSDVGSPLMQPVRHDDYYFRYYQIGVASYGFDSDKPDKPAVYASVQYFIDWIQEKMKNS